MAVWRLAAAGAILLFVSTALAQQPACTSVTLSPPNANVGGGGSVGTIQVATANPANCRWSASSNTPWITISFGTSGVVGGTVGYSVGPNPSLNQRVGSISVSGTTFTLTQAGASCTTSLSPNSTSIGFSGGSGSVTVLSPAGCAWNPVPNVGWITITSFTGTGNGFVQYSVDRNTNAVSRIGAITIGTSSFTITQSGFSCSYSVSPTNASVGVAGGAGVFTVNAPDTCRWTATSNSPDWLSVTSDPAGIGAAPVSYNVLANTGAASRTGAISVGTATFTVNQAASCSVAISPAQVTVAAAATTGTIHVTTNLNSCERPATSDSSWLTITSGANDLGTGDVHYSVTANTAPTPRTGNIFIGPQTFTLTQIASNCTFTVNPSFVSVPASGGTGRIDVVTGCTWTAATDSNWVLLTGATSGSGNGSVPYSVARNSVPQTRTATLTIGGAVVNIRQDAGPQTGGCTYSISPTGSSVPAGGGSGSISITAGDGCAWTAATAASWISFTTGVSGSGSGDVGYSAAANTSPSQRRGTITVAGLNFELIQEGTACTYSIAPLSASFPSSGGGGTIDVTSPCTWSASANRAWIAITSGSPGTGNASVTYTVAANPSAQSRSGAITVAGLAFNVSQSGVPCAVTLAQTSGNLAAPGGSGTVGVTGTSGCVWTATTDAGWLKVTWAAADGSGTVYYTAEPNTMPAARSAQIQISGQVFTLTQDFGPVVASAGVVNAASFAKPPVSPGLIVTVFGSLMGPDALVTLQLTPDGSAITTELLGTRVLFDGAPAPIVYTSAGQLSAIVPYAVAGKMSTRMVVEYNGTKSNSIQLPVAASAPAIFTVDASGSGQGAILNQNNSVNSTTAPAARNSVVQIFATGEGETTPDGIDGLLVPANALAKPTLPVTVRIGNVDAPVTYAGSAPGMVAGLLQVNARIASNTPLGDAVPVVLTIGGVQSQPGVTMVIR